ncbi:hypothetical protein IFM89_010079 [Coptis chinensis]|uniref:Pentatricopeptide repeat-containing protein n=1 Tax=Coptis chinensis TaxID=261450 RepID=A0A835I0W1_9MAGN|nr:hypothetical protein IFM89_010079 [Coptis chinensis]
MNEAKQVFERMLDRDLDSWDDEWTFLAVFAACGSADAIEECILHFDLMKNEYGISPSVEHYVGIVDVLDRAEELMVGLVPSMANPKKIPTPPPKKRSATSLLDGKNRVNEYCHLPPYKNEEKPKEQGYVPDTRYVLHAIDQEAKEQALLYPQ